MSDTIRSPAQMTQQARDHLATVDTITVYRLAEAIKIGPPFATRLIDQFEAEGLISAADRNGRHNVRSASGRLAEPTTQRRKSWEEHALALLQRMTKARDR